MGVLHTECADYCPGSFGAISPLVALRGNGQSSLARSFHRSHTSPAEAEVFVVAFENLWMAKTRDASLSAVRDRGRSGGLVPGPGAVLVIAAVVRRVIVTARFLMPLTPVG